MENIREYTHCIPQNPRRVGNIVAVHGLLDGPNTYTTTPPRSLNYRRSGVQDWTTKKAHTGTTPATLRLERNSKKVEEGRPLVKMSANWEVVGTWRTEHRR